MNDSQSRWQMLLIVEHHPLQLQWAPCFGGRSIATQVISDETEYLQEVLWYLDAKVCFCGR